MYLSDVSLELTGCVRQDRIPETLQNVLAMESFKAISDKVISFHDLSSLLALVSPVHDGGIGRHLQP